jgi:SAM-dependent methyltransferase
MMTKRIDLKRYDLFGWDYESVNALTDAEVQWHLLWAGRTGGPVLGLACGTGRLLCRLAKAGFEVLGLDLSPTMLGLARRNVSRLPAEARARVRLIRGDMSRFSLGRQFGLIAIADNSFRELRTRKSLLACLRCIRRHLLPHGRVLITERRFDPSLYPEGRRVWGWSEPHPHPGTGEMISRRGEILLGRDHRRARGVFVYRTTHRDGGETIQECPWSAPILRKQEYMKMFRRAGFAASVFPGYREVKDDGRDPLLCFVCRRPER